MVTIVVLCCVWISRASAQEPSEYKVALMEYVELSGAAKSMNSIFDQVVGMMGLTNDQKTKVMANVKEKAMASLWDSLLPVYQKHVSLEDLEAANEFYKTPAGQRLGASVAAITSESQQAGMEWGMNLAEMIQVELLK